MSKSRWNGVSSLRAVEHRVVLSGNTTLVLSGIGVFVLFASARTSVIPLLTTAGFLPPPILFRACGRRGRSRHARGGRCT